MLSAMCFFVTQWFEQDRQSSFFVTDAAKESIVSNLAHCCSKLQFLLCTNVHVYVILRNEIWFLLVAWREHPLTCELCLHILSWPHLFQYIRAHTPVALSYTLFQPLVICKYPNILSNFCTSSSIGSWTGVHKNCNNSSISGLPHFPRQSSFATIVWKSALFLHLSPAFLSSKRFGFTGVMQFSTPLPYRVSISSIHAFMLISKPLAH